MATGATPKVGDGPSTCTMMGLIALSIQNACVQILLQICVKLHGHLAGGWQCKLTTAFGGLKTDLSPLLVCACRVHTPLQLSEQQLAALRGTTLAAASAAMRKKLM